MIEEQAYVVEAGEGFAWVETRRPTRCGSCSANPVCGSAVLACLVGRQRLRLRAVSELPLGVGDEVIVGIDEGALVKDSLTLYLLPLLLMFLGALFGELVLGGDGEGATVLFGALGLLGGLLWLRLFSWRARDGDRWQPVVLRRVSRQGMLYDRSV